MLAQRGGRAYAALRPEGRSLHLLDWPTSITLAGVSPGALPSAAQPLRDPLSLRRPPHPPGPPLQDSPPSPAAQLPGSPGPANRGWGSPVTPGGLAERLEAPPGFELLSGMEGCLGRDPRSRRRRFGAAVVVRVSAVVWGTPRRPPRVVQRCAVFALCSSRRCAARIPGPAAQEAAGGAGMGERT